MESEEDLLKRVQKELALIEIEKKKIRERVERSYSSWLVKTIGQWVKTTFLN
jgi:hypothetical protein